MIDGGREAEIEILAWSGAVANRRAGTMDLWKPLRAAFVVSLASPLGLSAADDVRAKWNELLGLVAAPLSIPESSIAERSMIGERILVAFTVCAGLVSAS